MSETLQLGTNLREAREYLGLTLEFVANRLGVTEASVVAMEAGERTVSAEELEQLASLYSCSSSFLCGSEWMRVPVALTAAPGWDTLPDQDRAEVLRFAYFLQRTRTAPHPPLLQGEKT